MKKLFFSLITLFLLAACGTREKEISGPVLFDATRNYPEKQLLLDEVADITYVPLSSETDSALFRGTLVHVSERTVTIHDFLQGTFYLFDRSGRFLSSFNHKGQAPEDYNFLITAFVDEARGELFAIEKNRIQVYDLKGDYRRTLRLPDGAWVYEAADGGDGSILLVDNQERTAAIYAGMVDANAEAYEQPFVRISKEDGSLGPEGFLGRLDRYAPDGGYLRKVDGPDASPGEPSRRLPADQPGDGYHLPLRPRSIGAQDDPYAGRERDVGEVFPERLRGGGRLPLL